jgi:hypothetical protein
VGLLAAATTDGDIARPEDHRPVGFSTGCTRAPGPRIEAARVLVDDDGCGLAFDLGFVDRRAAQEARALVGLVLDDLRRQADGFALSRATGFDARELQQQPVGVVQPGPVVRAGMQLLKGGPTKAA